MVVNNYKTYPAKNLLSNSFIIVNVSNKNGYNGGFSSNQPKDRLFGKTIKLIC